MIKMNASQLRSSQGGANLNLKIKRQEIYLILDNVLDTYNIGSIFRLADALAVKKIYLCGGSATPPNPRIKKASINTTEVVPWEYAQSPVSLIKKLRSKVANLQVVAIEQDRSSLPFDRFNYRLPIALVVGHESFGVSKEVLDGCDGVVELPMYGVNISLNVVVSLGIVLYQLVASANKDLVNN